MGLSGSWSWSWAFGSGWGGLHVGVERAFCRRGELRSAALRVVATAFGTATYEFTRL
jgi:hypothetical protein